MGALRGLISIQILRTDGREEVHDVGKHIAIGWCRRMIGADALDSVNLRDGRVMLVDDNGYDVEAVEIPPPPGVGFAIERRCVRARKPVNAKATALYHGVCIPGTIHQIVGDVAVLVDEDLA